MNSCVEIKLQNRIVPAVKYLKGFSILTIVLMHLIQMMSKMPLKIVTMSAIGGAGVHVFFLCSGIGLYLSYLKHKVSFTEFIKKKFFKIYIPYVIVIAISFFLPWLYNGEDRINALLSHIFLFKMFIPKYENSFGIQFWYISTIFQLYLLFIPMCLMKEKIQKNRLFFVFFLTLSLLWWFACYILKIGHERIWSSFCLQYIWEFALGFIIAEKLYNKRVFKIKNFVLFITGIIGIGLQATMAITSEEIKLFNDIPSLIGYTSIALLLMNIPIFKLIGDKLSTFSYEFFLVHILVFSTMFNFANPQDLTMQIFVGIVSFIVSIFISYGYNIVLNKYVYKHFGYLKSSKKNL